MKIIIAGGRDFNNYKLLKYKTLEILKTLPSGTSIVIVQGGAEGADSLAKMFAKERGAVCQQVDADWSDLYAPGAMIKEGRYGHRYNARAGFDRNVKMAKMSQMLIAFWNGSSPGTKHMIETARLQGLVVHVIKY